MVTRSYQFINGPESSTAPTVGTPTESTDALTLGYADANYVKVDTDGQLSSLLTTNQGALKLSEQTGNGTNYVGLKAPDAVTSDIVWKLPDGDGSNGQVMKTDGSGALGWASVATLSNFDTLSKSADYTITDSDDAKIVLVTTGASDVTITLPTVADNTDRYIIIKKVDSGAGKVIVDGEGSEEIDGNTSFDLNSQYDFMEILSDGTAWNIVRLPLSPTSMSAADATKLGYYQYIGGSTYNSVTISITGDDSFSLTRATLIPYIMADGTWRLKFNIEGSTSYANRGYVDIVGIVFKNGINQAVSTYGTTTSYQYGSALALSNTNRIETSLIDTALNRSISGDVELNEAPTWIY